MDSADALIQKALNNTAHPNWSIFKMSLRNCFLSLLKSLFYTILFLSLTAIFLFEYFQTLTFSSVPQTDRYLGLIAGVLGLFSLIKVILLITALFYKQSNILILTDDQLIKSWRGKSYSISYTDITALKGVNIAGRNTPMPLFGEHYIQFIDTRTNLQIRIGEKDFYQNFTQLFTLLNSKIS